MPQTVVCILGPTASGKSALAEALAKRFGGEIVSADSMQVYRGMDIGTAKAPRADRSVPYHCIDILDPGQPYSVALFQEHARAAIDAIFARGATPFLVGGTGLYIRAVLDDMKFAPGEQEGNEVRRKYEELARDIGPKALHGLLEERDPESASMVHPNNVVRVIRALEMAEAGESYAKRKTNFKHIEPYYPSLKIALAVDPAILRRRIDQRVDDMLAQGLVDEVRTLLSAGFRKGLTATQAIGYKEFVAFLDGQVTIDEATEAVKSATRRYAKRQRTWLRSESDVHWLDADAGIDEKLVDAASQLLSADVARS